MYPIHEISFNMYKRGADDGKKDGIWEEVIFHSPYQNVCFRYNNLQLE